MNDLRVLDRNVQTMSSLEIAKLTGKEHKNVLRDIGSLLDSLSSDLSLGFKTTTYTDVTGKSNKCYELDKDSSLCLVSGYRERNIKIDKVKDPRFGSINAYHVSILEEIIQE